MWQVATQHNKALRSADYSGRLEGHVDRMMEWGLEQFCRMRRFGQKWCGLINLWVGLSGIGLLMF